MIVSQDPQQTYLNFCLNGPVKTLQIPFSKNSCMGFILRPFVSILCKAGFYKSQTELESLLSLLEQAVTDYSEEPHIREHFETCTLRLREIKHPIQNNQEITSKIDNLIQKIISEHLSFKNPRR